MKIEYLLSFIIFIGINSIENISIIRIPESKEMLHNITTKNGFINYSFEIFSDEFIHYPIFAAIYRLEGIKNLNLLNLTELKIVDKRGRYNEIYTKNKDSIKLQFNTFTKDLFNDIICKILYKTKYIDKMIYSYGIFNNKKYKYFGGIPENVIKEKNLKKFTFSKNDYVSKIIIRSSEDSFPRIYGKERIYTLNGEGRFIEIIDYNDYMVCIPNQHTNLFNMYKRCRYENFVFHRNTHYKLDKRQHNFFGSITFMIGNKNITLNRNDLLLYSKITDINFLEIDDDCQNITFGRKFIKLFEFSEFNMETKEVSLFMSQKKKTITETEIKKEILYSNINSNYYIIILLLSFFAFIISIILVKNYHKNKKIQYYDEYYNI